MQNSTLIGPAVQKVSCLAGIRPIEIWPDLIPRCILLLPNDMVDPQEIHRLIAEALPGAHVEVLDPMRDGEHLQAVVASDKFVGLPLVRQHKLVMDALREPLKDRLHALQLKTITPDQIK